MLDLPKMRQEFKGMVERAQDAVFQLANAHAAEIEISVARSREMTKEEYAGIVIAILGGALADMCASQAQHGMVMGGHISNELVKVEISTLIGPHGGQC